MILGAHGKAVNVGPRSVVGRVCEDRAFPSGLADHVWVTCGFPDPERCRGLAGVITTQRLDEATARELRVPVVHSIPQTDHLEEGDVVALDERGYVRTLYRVASDHNSVLVTEQCNSYCVMCSQPPRLVDHSPLVEETLRLLELIDPSTRELGITGGEPTLLKDDLIRILRKCAECIPGTAIHVLSNGRLFYYDRFARAVAGAGVPNLMIGIPLYSDLDYVHDHVVQTRGAFDETVIGIHNLGRHRVPVEIRVVVHADTYDRLPQLARYLYRNVPFAAHVAFMGLEMMGFAVPNLDSIWIDPVDYAPLMERAVRYLDARGLPVSVYNHQLCTVPEALWPFCRKSISDWKNVYLPACDSCSVKTECAGFFASSAERRYSDHIRPIQPLPRSDAFQNRK